MTDSSSTSRRGLTLTYRPHRFADLVGQRHAAAILGRLVVAGRLPQQILLTGGSGLGKTTVARIVAASILCTTPLADRDTGDACGTCQSCTDIAEVDRLHPDVIEMDAASHGGKDEIRDLASRAVLTPVAGTHRIYIIDEVHAISGAGTQAALKLLEEPPAHVVFLLCTTNPEKLSSGAGGNGTIRSRCLELELLRPTDAELSANLQRIAAGEGWNLHSKVADAVIAATAPELGVRGTVMTLAKLAAHLDGDPDIDEVTTLLGLPPASLFAQLFDTVLSGDRTQLYTVADTIRQHVPDAALRRELLRQLRTRMTDEDTTDLDAWRFAAAVATPAGVEHTDALLLMLTRPELAVPPAALDTASEQTLEQLTDAIRTARTAYTALRDLARDTGGARPLADPQGPTDSPEPDDVPAPAGTGQPGPGEFAGSPLDGTLPHHPAEDPAADAPPPSLDEEPDTELYDRHDLPQAPEPASVPSAGRAPAPDHAPAAAHKTAKAPLVRQMFALLAERDRELARTVAACHVLFAPQQLVIEAPPGVVDQLTSRAWYPILTDVSRELGRRVSVRNR